MSYSNLVYCHVTSSGVIDALYCGEIPPDGGFERVPDHVSPSHGDLRGFWDKDWNLIPLVDLVSSGVVPCPGGYKLIGRALIEMTLEEKIDVGIVLVPSGSIYDAVEKVVRPMTATELGEAHLIDLEVLKSILVAQASSVHLTLLDRGFGHGGVQYSGKDSLQQRATSILTAVVAGIPPVFPMEWPNAQDETVLFTTLDAFRAFAAALMAFVQTTDKAVGDVKTAIRAATDTAVAAQLFTDWEALA